MVHFIGNNKSYSRHPSKTLTTYFLDQLEADGCFTSGVEHIRNQLSSNFLTGSWLPPQLRVDGHVVHTVMGHYNNESEQNDLALAKSPLTVNRFDSNKNKFNNQNDGQYRKNYDPRSNYNGNHSRDTNMGGPKDKNKQPSDIKCPVCGRNHSLNDCRDTGKYLSITEFLARTGNKERNDILKSYKANQKAFLDRVKETRSRRGDSACQRIKKYETDGSDQRRLRTFAIDYYELSQDEDLTFCTFDKSFDLDHEIEITFEDLETLDDFETSESPTQE